MSRRSFLRGIIAVAAAATVVKFDAIAHAAIPHIYGDGIHDDTEGLRAAIEGKPFTCEGCVVMTQGNRIVISQGTFLLTSTLSIDGNGEARASMRGNKFVVGDDWKGSPGRSMLEFRNMREIDIDGSSFVNTQSEIGVSGPRAAVSFAGSYP